MSISTELRLMVEPFFEWSQSINKHAMVLSLIGIVVAIIFRAPLAKLFLSLNAKVLRSMSIDLPENVRVGVEDALKIIIVCTAVLFAFEAVDPPATLGDILQKLTLTIMVVAIFAAWYKLAAAFVEVLRPRKTTNLLTEMDWAVRVTRFAIILLGIAALLQLWSIDVSAALTGVGVLGAGVAIAAQDMLKNFFGGMSNVSEKRFVTGDWIHVDGVAEGFVKQIDLRSTTIVGFDRVPRYVPNSDLANATVHNLSRRDHRRIDWVVPLVLSASFDQVENVCAGVRKYLQTSGDFVLNDELLCLAQVSGISAYAVEIKIYAFTVVSGYEDYLNVCERLTACILKTVDQAGTSMAYPTRSLIVENTPDETG